MDKLDGFVSPGQGGKALAQTLDSCAAAPVRLSRKCSHYQGVDKLRARRLSSRRGTVGQACPGSGRIRSGHYGATPWIRMTSAVRRMSPLLRVAQIRSRSTRRVDCRPALLCSMPQSSLQVVTYAIADAMLAGPADPATMVERMTRVLGESAGWMTGLARRVEKRFGARWDSVEAKHLSKIIAETAGFVAAWKSQNRPRIVRVLTRPPVQRPAPRWLRDVTLPQLPTIGDLAAWLDVEPLELDWFADRWRVAAHDATTRLHHYSYKAIEKRDGRCRIIEIPKSRLRELQRKVLHGLLDRIPAHDASAKTAASVAISLAVDACNSGGTSCLNRPVTLPQSHSRKTVAPVAITLAPYARHGRM